MVVDLRFARALDGALVMQRVLLESPYAKDVHRNREYLRECMQHSFACKEAPFASHRFYTDVLNDDKPAERAQGIEAGLLWGECADKTVVYADFGVSDGMKLGILRAVDCGRRIVFRWLHDARGEAEGEPLVIAALEGRMPYVPDERSCSPCTCADCGPLPVEWRRG